MGSQVDNLNMLSEAIYNYLIIIAIYGIRIN